jgi:hypothetical protein
VQIIVEEDGTGELVCQYGPCAGAGSGFEPVALPDQVLSDPVLSPGSATETDFQISLY